MSQALSASNVTIDTTSAAMNANKPIPSARPTTDPLELASLATEGLV